MYHAFPAIPDAYNVRFCTYREYVVAPPRTATPNTHTPLFVNVGFKPAANEGGEGERRRRLGVWMWCFSQASGQYMFGDDIIVAPMTSPIPGGVSQVGQVTLW